MSKSKEEIAREKAGAEKAAKELRRAGARVNRLALRLERINAKISQHTAAGNKEKVAQFEAEQERREAEIQYLLTRHPELKQAKA